MQNFQAQTRFRDATPFAANLLAFFGGKARQEILEIAVVPVLPMKLAAAPQQQFVLCQAGILVFFSEQALPGGATEFPYSIQRRSDKLLDHGQAFDPAPDQKSRAGRRSVVDAADQLGIVADAVLFEGRGPIPVARKIPEGMRPEIQRQSANQQPGVIA